MGNHGLYSAAVTVAIAEETGWHRDFYLDLSQHPELSFAEHRTARRIADWLQELGFDEVHTGVGVLRNGEGTGVLARADMDALPVKEIDGDHASTATGTNADGNEVPVMHACGQPAGRFEEQCDPRPGRAAAEHPRL